MHLLLDLGQLCAAKMRGQESPAFLVQNVKTKKTEARVSCVAVAPNGEKRGVVICMDPLVLRSYQAVHGSLKTGDPLHILPTDFEIEIERRSFAADKAYFLITTETLSRAPAPAHSKEPKPTPAHAEPA
jgi:non-ribosomal peptide synthetase component F